MYSLGFDPDGDLTGLRPAPYNPRHLDEAAAEELRESLRRLGLVRPIIATADGTIVAGHQRTMTCKALGVTRGALFIVPPVCEGDEVRFNQLHNGTDVELNVQVRLPAGAPGWAEHPPEAIDGELLQPGGPVRHEIYRLVNRYGLWGGAVAMPDGRVVSGGQYALACKAHGRPCRVCYLTPEGAEHAEYLARTYGVFDYSRVPSTPWQQTFCQPQRYEGSQTAESPLYREFVLPRFRRRERLLDLGCGVGAYVRRMRAAGLDATGWEPYPREFDTIDRNVARALTLDLIAALGRGPFDVGVSDSVVNATGSVDRSRDVLRGLALAVRQGGRVYVSGIEREALQSDEKSPRYGGKDGRIRRIHFLDDKGFTANHYHGGWMFQWANREADARALLEAHIGPVVRMDVSNSYWRAEVTNTRPEGESVLLEAALREFDPAYPDGVGLGLAAEVQSALARNLRA